MVWEFFGDHLWLSREVLLTNPRQPCARILLGLSRDYPSAPETYTVPDENMWSNTPPPYNQFMTPPPTNFDQSFNPSTNYNHNQTYQSPPQPTITPQSHIQAILNKVIMEKAPEHQTIHLMTSIQLSTPHKPVTQTNHNTPRSTYQPLHTL